MRHQDAFGINMKNYMAEHETYLKRKMQEDWGAELLTYHAQKIAWLQHERLIHLLVTLLTALFFMFLCLSFLPSCTILPGILLTITGLLLAAYILHYFRLENTVQRWYKLYDDLWRHLNRPD